MKIDTQKKLKNDWNPVIWVLIESFLMNTNMTSGVFKIRYVLVLLTIVALALEGLMVIRYSSHNAY